MKDEEKAEQYVKENGTVYYHSNGKPMFTREEDLKFAFLAGLKEGRPKWHYIKDKLPPSGETVLLYFGTDIMGKAVMCTGCVDCRGEWYKNIDEEPYMWQEIILPKE